MAEISQEIRDTVQRRIDASARLQSELAAAIDSFPADAVKEIAKALMEEVGYLGEHLPEEREDVAPFACSGQTYHYCSFTTQHDPGCPAAGGDGKLTGDFKHATPCPPDCGETEAEPWCHVSGFDCWTCEIVDRLLGILAARGRKAR